MRSGELVLAAPRCVRLAPAYVVELAEVSAAMDQTELRILCTHRVDALLSAVPLPNPWDIDTFLDRLEHHRKRAIDLAAVQWTVGDSTGAWRRREDHDIIAYPANTSPVHQDHIILHEVAHMVADHRGRCVLSVQEAHQRAPTLAPAAFAHLLDRVNIQSEEREAETMAIMILARIARQDRRSRRSKAGRPLDGSTAATLTRLTSAFDQL